MTEPFNTFSPPESDSHYGYVVGRVIRRIGDTTLDVEPYLDAANVTGLIKFVPVRPLDTSENYSAFVYRETISCPLDEFGHLLNSSLQARGVWLTVGDWEVNFHLSGVEIRPFYINVTEDFNEQRPLDLAKVAPYTPPSKFVNTMLVPTGGKPGDTLVRQADNTLAWTPYILDGVTLEDLKGPKGDTGDTGDTGSSGPSGGVLSENMLANGLFELGTMQYMSNGTIVKTDLPVDNGVPFKISYPLGAMNPSPAYPPVPITGSETYMIEYWVKASKPNAWLYMSIMDEKLGFLQASDTIGGPEHANLLAETDRVPTTWQRKVAYIRRTTSSSSVNRAAKYLVFKYFTLNQVPPGQTVAADADFEFGGIRVRPVAPSVVNDRSISQDKLAFDAIGDKSNLMPDGDNFGELTWPNSSATQKMIGGGRVSGSNARRVTTNGVGLTGGYGAPFAIQPGTYRLSAYVKPSATIPEVVSGAPGAVGLHALSTQVAFTRSSLPANVWTKIEGTLTVPEAMKTVSVGTYVQPSVPAGTTVDFSDIAIKEIPNMTVVPDGSVDTDKLVNKSVTTNKIADGAIGTLQIAPKAITKDLLADSISLGGTMPWYNVKDYGAKGDKATDDSAAIQAAIDAAPVNGVIFFPTGWYIVNTTLTMKKGQVLYGLSRRHVNAGAAYGPVIRTTMPGVVAVSMDAGTVEGINFYGPGETGYGIAASKDTVAIKMVGSGKIKDVAIYGFSLGIDTSACWYGHVEHSYIRCCDLAIKATNCYNLKLYNIRIHGLFYDGTRGNGIDLRDRTMMAIHGGSIEHVKIGAMFNGGNQSLEADDVYFETGHEGAVAYAFNSGASHLSVTNNQVYMDHVLRFVTMASTASAGSSLYASGNKFKASSESTLADGAVCYGLSSLVDSAVILGDDWVGMKGFSKYKYATSTPSNKLIVAPTAVKATIT